MEEKEKIINKGVEVGAATYTSLKTIEEYKSYIGARQAHGFIAEIANDKVDKVLLKDATIIGDSNIKNGADRLVDGTSIQTKYCNTSNNTVNSAFGENGLYKYFNADGSVMNLEVPKDQYNEAVEIMKKKIIDGKIPGFENPEQAMSIIKRGHFNYDTCVKIAKMGTIEGIVYDVSNSIVSSTFVGGLSAGISFVFNFINSSDINKSLKESVKMGTKAFGISLTSSVINAQLLRSGLIRNIANRVGESFFGGIVTQGVVLGFQTISDFRKLIDKEISVETFLRNLKKNMTTAVGGMAGASLGYKVAGGVGAFIGAVGGALIGAAIGEKIFGYKEADVEKKLSELYSDLQKEIDKLDDIEISFIKINKIKEMVESENGINKLMKNYSTFLEIIKNEIKKQVEEGNLLNNKKIILSYYENKFIEEEERHIEKIKDSIDRKLIEIENRIKELSDYHIAKLKF